ncbi:MAG TPA: alpha/beta hydrolase [Allosphingosinicella sp.]|jgi:pimeloyl-ACP methyl ester carboxylesterase|nr:alpha/beta hydrolase [Allosphingosinicella sp.]
MHWGLWVVGVLLILLAIGAWWERLAGRAFARRYPAPGRILEVAPGRHLHLLCEGEAGPVIVVEQGAGEPSLLWRTIQKEARKFSRFCLYDRPGYLWSPPAPGPRTIEARAEDLHVMLERASLPGPYVLVAHSYGGLVVRAFARRFPEATAGLVMVDAIEESIAFHPDYQRFLRRARPFVAVLRGAAMVGLPRLFGTLFGGTSKDADDAAMSAATIRPSFFAAIADDMASLRRPPTDFGGLGDTPLIVLTHGKPFPGPFAALEPFWRAGQEHHAALSTRGELLVAENSNHMIAGDEPERVIEALKKMVEMVGRN